MMYRFCWLLCIPFSIFSQCAGINWGATSELYNVAGQKAILSNIAINDSGTTIAAWVNNTTGQAAFIQAVISINGKPGQVVDFSYTGGNATLNTPAVAIDPKGNAIVVWNEFNTNHYVVQSAIYSVSTNNWIVPHSINDSLSPTGFNAGDAVAAWNGDSFSVAWTIFGSDLQATTVDSLGNSTSVVAVSAPAGSQKTSTPYLASNSNGDLLLTWINATATGGGKIAQAAFKPKGGSWGQPSAVSGTDIAQLPVCAIDLNLNGIVSWSIANGTSHSIIKAAERNFSSSSVSWSNLTILSSSAANPPQQMVGLNDQGGLSAVWVEQQSVASNYNSVILAADKKINDSSWNIEEFLSDPLHSAEGCLSYAVDGANNGVVCWSYDAEGSYHGAIAALSKPSCLGYWNFPETTLSTNFGVTPGFCNLSMSRSGVVACIWSAIVGTTSVIQTSVGTLPLLDVSNLKGDRKVNDFGLISEIYDELRWELSPSVGVVGQKIYKDGKFLATLGPKQTCYEIHNLVKEAAATYQIVTLNTFGITSPGVTIVIRGEE
jgi:hypothetical protein